MKFLFPVWGAAVAAATSIGRWLGILTTNNVALAPAQHAFERIKLTTLTTTNNA